MHVNFLSRYLSIKLSWIKLAESNSDFQSDDAINN